MYQFIKKVKRLKLNKFEIGMVTGGFKISSLLIKMEYLKLINRLNKLYLDILAKKRQNVSFCYACTVMCKDVYSSGIPYKNA